MNNNSANENYFGILANEVDLENLITEENEQLFIRRILELLNEQKAEEIVFINVKSQTNIADYLLICQGRSQLHCRSIAQNVEYNLKQAGEISLGIEGEREGNWVLLDYGNIILHVFHPEIRKYYKLEELYSKKNFESNTQNANPEKIKVV